jgi:hypothetical protein
MRYYLIVLILLVANVVLACEFPVQAGCVNVSIAATSTQIFPAPGDRLDYLFVQNVSTGCIIWCALGSGNTATFQGGTQLVPQAAWSPAPPIPSSADLACIGSNNGTPCTGAAYACEW